MNESTLPIHMHQGGTLNAMCGISLSYIPGRIVSWDDAAKVTCRACLIAAGSDEVR